MSLNHTPQASRIHITLFGRCNSGKSSLINALTGQDVALVSNTPGTTTDPVRKAMEIHGIGPCLFIDTPGFDDTTPLGERRMERTLRALEQTDIALLLCHPDMEEELSWMERLKQKHIPTLLVLTKADARTNPRTEAEAIYRHCGTHPLLVSARTHDGVEQLKERLIAQLPSTENEPSIIPPWLKAGDTVVLVMPQDAQAPKGRIILPQVQTLRELLDRQCVALCLTTQQLAPALQTLKQPPALIITDSQAFATVYRLKPPQSQLTSFSVLFAQHKGDIDYYLAGAAHIENLPPTARILIAEACTHAPLSEDIGRVKLPQLLRQKLGERITVEVASGRTFPDDLSPYALIIQCGGCMFNRKYMLHRIDQAKQQGVAMTNYGIAIAHLNGILDKINITPIN